MKINSKKRIVASSSVKYFQRARSSYYKAQELIADAIYALHDAYGELYTCSRLEDVGKASSIIDKQITEIKALAKELSKLNTSIYKMNNSLADVIEDMK